MYGASKRYSESAWRSNNHRLDLGCFIVGSSMLHLDVSTLPETNSSPLKIDGWKMNFLLGNPICRCYALLLVSGRVGLFLRLPSGP